MCKILKMKIVKIEIVKFVIVKTAKFVKIVKKITVKSCENIYCENSAICVNSYREKLLNSWKLYNLWNLKLWKSVKFEIWNICNVTFYKILHFSRCWENENDLSVINLNNILNIPHELLEELMEALEENVYVRELSLVNTGITDKVAHALAKVELEFN